MQEKTALTRLREIKPDLEARAAILVRLEAWKASDDWTRDGGAYVPGMGKFFADGWYERSPISTMRNGKAPTALMPTPDEYYPREHS